MGVRVLAVKNTASIQTELKTSLALRPKGTENLRRTGDGLMKHPPPQGKHVPSQPHQWTLV